jgi:hypothetical protein
MGLSLDYERHLSCIQRNKFNNNWKPHEKKSFEVSDFERQLGRGRP